MPVELTPRGTYGAAAPKGVTPFLMKIGMSVVSTLIRFSGPRVITLTTVGARSGQPRATDLIAVPDGPDAWIIAASSAGSAQHPSWYFNMAKHPDQIWLRDARRRTRVDATTLHGEAAEAGYRTKTDRDPGRPSHRC